MSVLLSRDIIFRIDSEFVMQVNSETGTHSWKVSTASTEWEEIDYDDLLDVDEDVVTDDL